MKPKFLVADTAAFVKNIPLWDQCEEVVTVDEVIDEIRDHGTRQWLEALPITITRRQPQPKYIKFVNEFSKKTGDYASLSLADVKVLALTYEVEIEARGGSADHLRSQPQKILTHGLSKNKESQEQTETTPNEQTFPETSKEEGECQDVEQVVDNTHNHDCPEEDHTQKLQQQECEDEGSDESGVDIPKESDDENEEDNNNEDEEEDDDDSGWITPSNIKQHKMKNKHCMEDMEEEEGEVLVACMSSDFALQNVLKHIGLSVMGVDGKLIKSIKTYILRCYACFRTTSIMSKLFCPHCGNKTLKKVCVTVDPDGSQRIWINPKKQINIRGMKYSLPTPKGGKHGRNPLLVADQREAKHWSSKMSSKKVNPLNQDYDPDHQPFAVRDVYSRASQLGYIGGKEHVHHYWEKRNPNEPQRKTGKKKK